MLHYLCGSSLSNYCKLLSRFGPIAPKYWGRAALIFLIILLRTPFTIGQKLIFERKIRQANLHPAPVFILGHWRSGTTLLHETLSQDKNLAPVSYLQALFPWDFLGETRGWRAILGFTLPKQRPMDRVCLHADAPAEDGLALANMCVPSFYHAFCFPQSVREIFRQGVLEEGVNAEDSQERRKLFLYFLRKVSLVSGNRRLVLKDPAHTAQLSSILKMFPEAKFIYIERKSEEVLSSFLKMFYELSSSWRLEDMPDVRLFELSLKWMHQELIACYSRDKAMVPKGNLLELQYDELLKNPQNVATRLHAWLGS